MSKNIDKKVSEDDSIIVKTITKVTPEKEIPTKPIITFDDGVNVQKENSSKHYVDDGYRIVKQFEIKFDDCLPEYISSPSPVPELSQGIMLVAGLVFIAALVVARKYLKR